MKYKHTTLLAAIVLMGLTIFASCKKDNETKAPEANNIQSASITHPEQIDDMNAYLEQFKQQLMGDSKGDEMMTVEDANWFLTNLSNYDFGNVVEQFDDIMFNDIYTDVNISNGLVSLADLNDAYKQIFNEIRSYYRNLDLQDKDFRFIKCEIQEDGTVKTHVTVTYGDGAKAFGGFYFDSESICSSYLDSNLTYTGNTVAVAELNRLLNQLVHTPETSEGKIYYTIHSSKYFEPLDLIDTVTPSPNDSLSRLYFRLGGYYNEVIPYEDMVYNFDSYAGIIDEYRPLGCMVASVQVRFGWGYVRNIAGNDPTQQTNFGHDISITYGVLHTGPTNPSID